jgi:hypothetical protein
MKKITSLLALLGVVASLSLTACSSSETPENTETPGGTAPTEEPATPPAEGQ